LFGVGIRCSVQTAQLFGIVGLRDLTNQVEAGHNCSGLGAWISQCEGSSQLFAKSPSCDQGVVLA